MNVMVCGSRNLSLDISKYIPPDTTMIISGGAFGIDSCAERYADQHNLLKTIIKPDYKKYGRAAPLIRNRQMVDIADIVIAVWDGKSRGTKYTIDYAISINKKVKIYKI